MFAFVTKSAEFFMDTLQNPLIREDVARDGPDTLDSAFMLVKDSLGETGTVR